MSTATPATRTNLVMSWLAENPGMHRPTDIASGLGLDTTDVAKTCRHLYEQGHIARVRTARNRSVYGLPTT